jgi:leucyl/phenylalanyl-tRNA--protein transferase
LGYGDGRLFSNALFGAAWILSKGHRGVDLKTIVPILGRSLTFPDPCSATDEGLVAVGGDLSVSRLLAAYRLGIFPWTVGPVTWWSPDPRGILELDAFHVSRSFGRVLRQELFQTTLDQAFSQVIEGCAAPGPGRRSTWITDEFIAAYKILHQQGHAHSVECWQNGKLAGGIYGVAVGGFFAGESMFHLVSNASKVALFQLVEHLRRQQFELFDIQMLTPITQQLGGRAIPRSRYLERLKSALSVAAVF